MNRKFLPHILTIVVLLTIFLVYGYSISHERLPLGNADHGTRLHMALEYARDPGKALSLKAWLHVWPPVPLIIQGFILRLVLFPGMSISTGIMAVQLTSVFLVLLGFYFIGRSVALQTDEPTGLLACLMCLSTSIMLYLAPTTSSGVYAFFFVSLAIWNLFQFIAKNKGFSWSVLSFALAFFCRSESLVLIFVAGAFLLAYGKRQAAIQMVGIIAALAFSKFLLAISLVDGVKFFEYGQLHNFGSPLAQARSLLRQFKEHNQSLILVSLVCTPPLIYYMAKLMKPENIFQATQVTDHQNGFTKNLSVTARRVNSKVWFMRIFHQVGLWIVRVPIFFWAALFLITIGVLIGEALRGNINAQWRYLFMTNVFMTTVIALLVAQAVRIIYAKGDKFAKGIAVSIILALVSFSLWSGFSHATGQKVQWKMSPSEKDVVYFIREHRGQGDRVVFDFLNWKEYVMSAFLLNPSLITPSQFSGADQEVKSLLPEQLQNQSRLSAKGLERRIATIHAFIHGKNPRFMVLPSDKFYEKIRKKRVGTVDRSNSYIREYLSPVKGTKSMYLFQSPYVLSKVKIPFTKIHENKEFIILEREPSSENSREENIRDVL